MQESSDTTIDMNKAQAMVDTMANMQVAHNRQVHPEWESQGYDYYRAIWVECAEMLDHFGWKWWKKQDGDIDQVKLELVDIWHFALSEMIRAGTLNTDVVMALQSLQVDKDARAEDFRHAIEVLAGSSLTSRSFEMRPFIQAMRTLPMTFAELFDMYIGKNVLNHFRQDHGYKDGTYQKLWQGREDNEHLVELLGELQCAPEALSETLYAALESRYGT